ncbi:FAD/NAD(P)-binding protein [Ciceribacter sp. RN22]|uniref:FAD/NAD(P)-binding protein n=1 Tax=Ciceribacter sp. RN22 TaxID=2954932 RepID=UPI0020926E7D|nr:FAD/NAD(P)-binding protein [Ciceribacter sp. RN22]MCO6177088.1 FAD/NAD(P)-binding protein [Ciceribacter sp. RN22]
MLQLSSAIGARTAPVFHRCRVVVIGGGFSGASVARQLALCDGVEKDGVVIFEPRKRIGAGLAYDTTDPSLRLNVAAHRMRALPGRPEAFAEWHARTGRLAADPRAVAGEHVFARRGDFGEFMATQMAPLIEQERIVHRREQVVHVTRRADLWLVTGEAGSSAVADELIIATGQPGPQAPKAIASALNGHPRLVADGLKGEWLSHVRTNDRVLVFGAGLTAADVVGQLAGRGHAGVVTLLSRSGLLPQVQSVSAVEPFGDFSAFSPRSGRQLLQRVRATVAEAESQGLSWQSVFDALRQQGQTIWAGLPLEEQARLLRHLKRQFETRRYRLPPQNARIMHDRFEAGLLRHRAGRICRIERSRHEISVDVIKKPAGTVERLVTDWAVVATGPDFGSVVTSQPWLAELERLGFVAADSLGLGVACDRTSRAIGRNGYPVDSLFIAGPLARGTFGELTGVPEIATQADQIAHTIIARRASARTTCDLV